MHPEDRPRHWDHESGAANFYEAFGFPENETEAGKAKEPRVTVEQQIASAPEADRGSTKLRRLSTLMRDLGKSAKPTVLGAVSKIDATGSKAMSKIFELAPHAIVRVASDVTSEAVRTLKARAERDDPAKAKDLSGIARLIGTRVHDPRNAAESAEALDALATIASKSQELETVVGKALSVIEKKGALGETILRQVALFAFAVAATGGQVARVIEGGKVYLKAGPAKIGVDRTGEVALSLSVHNPMWAQNAVKLSMLSAPRTLTVGGDVKRPSKGARISTDVPITGRRGKRTVTLEPYLETRITEKEREVKTGVEAKLRFGAETAPHVEIKWPYPDVLYEQTALVHVPGPKGRDRWVRFAPIPAWIRTTLSGVHTLFNVRYDGPEEAKHDKFNSAYAALLMARAAMTPEWWDARIRPMVDTVHFTAQDTESALYSPENESITIDGGVEAPWFFPHEIGHVLDRAALLSERPFSRACYASWLQDHPFNGFTRSIGDESQALLEPVQRRLNRVFTETVFPSISRALLDGRSDGVPLPDVLVASGNFGRKESEVLVRQIFHRSIATTEIDVLTGRLEQWNRISFSQKQKELLSSLILMLPPKALLEAWEGKRTVEQTQAHSAYMYEATMTELLRPHEIFARFFHQYARWYAARHGFLSGPTGFTYDLPNHVFRDNLPAFLQALNEVRVVDLMHINAREAVKALLISVGLSGLAAVLTVAAAIRDK